MRARCTNRVVVLIFAPDSVKCNNISYCILILSISSSETDIDDCASHPCMNNGKCTDRVNGFNCSCAPGFNGSQCETGNCSQSNVFFFTFQVFFFVYFSLIFRAYNGTVMLKINRHHLFN